MVHVLKKLTVYEEVLLVSSRIEMRKSETQRN